MDENDRRKIGGKKNAILLSSRQQSHSREQPEKKKALRRSVNHFIRVTKFVIIKTIWWNVFKYIVVPIATFLAIYYYDIQLTTRTLYLSVFHYTLTVLAVTTGYHRYWSHRSYSIDPSYNILPVFFTIFGSSAGIESARKFKSLHRLHHMYCNTDKDPYNYRKNFFWAHLGWRIVKNRKIIRLLDEENELLQTENDFKDHEGNFDLEMVKAEKFLKWQEDNNFTLYVLFGLVAPSLMANYFWDDLVGGFVYSGLIRSFIAQQSIFSVNSLGHFLGSQPFEDKKTPRDSFIVSFLTFGEGYNNFHHKFPKDYRNGHYYYRYDPTKWFLNFCYRCRAIFGVKSLHRTSYNIIQRCALLHQQKLIDRHRAKLNWGVPMNKLPLITVDEFRKLVKSSDRALVIISGVVHDVTPFVHNHPGGVALIKASIGKDATSAFNGAVYMHSNAANNLLATMRIALIRDENTNSVIRQNRTVRNNMIMSATPLETADAA